MPNGQSKTEQEEFEAENGVPLEQGTTLGTTLVSAARAVWYRLIFYRDVFGAFAAVAAADKRANSEAFSTAETVASRYQTLPEWMDGRQGAQSNSRLKRQRIRAWVANSRTLYGVALLRSSLSSPKCQLKG